MTLHDYLNQLHPISPADYQRLAALLRPRRVKKGENLVVPGQVQKELYFVKSGVQMSYCDTPSKEHVMAFTYAPGLCAIPESFLFQAPSQYCLTCLTNGELDYLTYAELQLLFEAAPPIERLFRRMTEVILAGVLNRHTELHTLSMEERYRAFCRRSPHLLQLVPHKYIASYLGIDATNFSKLYNRVKI